MDIASLGIKVTTDGVTKAEADLNKLQSTGAKAEKSAESVAKSFDKNAKSAKELQFALRGVPAQFTDIATSLASGQRPLQVLLQQGGQLKDMFGGIGPAAKALGGYITGLINPFTVAAGLFGGLAYSLYQVDQEAKQDRETLRGFQQVLNSTGNAAGVTAQSIAALSEQLARGNGEVKAYGDVLKALLGTGEVFGPSLGKVAQDVKAIADATGKTAGQVIADYQKIFKDPAAAAVELSQKIQFLSADQFALVQRLDDTGEKGRAANIVIAALNESLAGGATSAEQYASKLGDIARKLDDIRSHPEKYNAGDLGGFSTSDAIAADLEAQRKTTVAAYVTASLNEQEKQLAAGARESIAAQSRLAAFASSKDKLDSALVQANKDRLAALYGVVDPTARAKIEAEYQAQVKAARDFYTRGTTSRGAADPLSSSITGDTRSSLTESIGKEIAAYKKEADQWARGTVAAAAYKSSLDDMLATRQRSIDLDVQSIGMGARQIQQQQALIAIDEDYNRKKDSLERQQRNSTSEIDRASYGAQLADLSAYHAKRLALEREGFARSTAAREDWTNGARAATRDYMDNAKDIATATYSVVTDVYSGLADNLAQFFTTGKADWRSYVADILKEIEKIQIAKLVAGLGSSLSGAFGFQGGTSASTFAKGGAFADSPSLSAYSGSVVSKPTMFAFARGAGVMGEAGPEAILPLSRGPDGKLGVKGGARGDVNISTVVNVDSTGSGSSTTSGDSSDAGRQLGKMIESKVRDVMTSESRPGGMLWRMQHA